MPKQLEQYLDSLEKPLSKLSATERYEWRLEAEQHLTSLAAAHEELGAEREAALEAAIAQFGDAQIIAHQMRSQTTGRRFYASPLQGIAGAVVLQLVVSILGLVGAGVVSVIYLKGDAASAEVVSTASAALLGAAPAIGGVLLGGSLHRWQLDPKATPRSKLSTSFTCLAIALATLLICATDSVLWTMAAPSRHGTPEIDGGSLFLRLSLTIISVAAGRAYYVAGHRRRMKATAR